LMDKLIILSAPLIFLTYWIGDNNIHCMGGTNSLKHATD
jgi:hypothetical protein